MKGTEIIIVGSAAYEQLKSELKYEMEEAVRSAFLKILDARGLDADWVPKEEAMKLLGIKKSKLQELRDTGEIVFSQRPGGKIILYNKNSINEYLERNRKTKF